MNKFKKITAKDVSPGMAFKINPKGRKVFVCTKVLDLKNDTEYDHLVLNGCKQFPLKSDDDVYIVEYNSESVEDLDDLPF